MKIALNTESFSPSTDGGACEGITSVVSHSDFDEFLMRMLDIVASVGMLLVLWPVMFLISLLIKLTSPVPMRN